MILNEFTEMHSHILPGIDDGAPDIETSLKMVKALKSRGARAIICTPHYYSDSISLDDFLERRSKAVSALRSALPPGSPRIIAGAEVYISKYLFSNERLDRIKIEGTDYALIEHPFSDEFGEKSCERLVTLICDWGVTPILAHIERYEALMKKHSPLEGLIDMGCLAQANISSFADERRKIKKRLFKLLDEGMIAFIGSDCHNMSSRPPEYENGAAAIEKNCGRAALRRLLDNSNAAANGEKI